MGSPGLDINKVDFNGLTQHCLNSRQRIYFVPGLTILKNQMIGKLGPAVPVKNEPAKITMQWKVDVRVAKATLFGKLR